MKRFAQMFDDGSYLNRFFEEKDIPEAVFVVTDSVGVEHVIPSGCVVEAIAQTEGDERRHIESHIRNIDFYNGDVNHFFEHLAGALAERVTL